jgi:hypothetical protein
MFTVLSNTRHANLYLIIALAVILGCGYASRGEPSRHRLFSAPS